MKVLAYTTPSRGHVYPIVPVLAALLARGHEVIACTLSEELAHLRQLGITCQALDRVVEANQLEDWRERSPRRAMRSAMSTFAERANAEAPDLARAIEQHDPDVLMIDINAWGAAIVAEASGRPWAMYSPYLLPLPSRDAPPFGLGLSPMGGIAGALRDGLVRRMGNALIGRVTLGPLNALRSKYGLAAVGSFIDLCRRPPLLLALTVEGFDYPRSDWPANVRLVGAINWAPREPTPKWLADVADPLVLVTCSTERQHDAHLLHVALRALPAEGIAVVGTSAAHDPDQFDVPAGSRVVRSVPHEDIIARATCVVCHGGMGVTQKALSAGVPVVVVPFGRDQLETARRVELAEAGVRLPARLLSADRLVGAVHIATDRRAGATRVAQAFSAAGGASGATDAIEALTPPS